VRRATARDHGRQSAADLRERRRRSFASALDEIRGAMEVEDADVADGYVDRHVRRRLAQASRRDPALQDTRGLTENGGPSQGPRRSRRYPHAELLDLLLSGCDRRVPRKRDR
jgi:hypothetical protein